MAQNPNTDMTALAQALGAAQLELALAREASQAANRREIDALNAVNAAQKAIDAAMSAMKSKAPRGTDWAHIARPEGVAHG